ncbi:MAG TPA: fused MFS/spermidine synthase [Vicinamibacteria bacterium]
MRTATGAALRLAAACLLSGAAALVYQVLWTRQLALLMGHTVAALSTVLATFMAGLALGSALAAHSVERVPAGFRPRAYALLELGIAGFALVFPWLLRAGLAPLAALYGSRAASPLVLESARLGLSAALLLVPTTLMGATLPMLAALTGAPAERAGRVAGTLYAANTVGAVAGSLASVFFLLPRLGIGRSTLLAAALNVAAAAIVGSSQGARRRAPSTAVRPSAPGHERLVLAVLALSGLGALADEVAWTRALVLLIGPTAYAFAFILATVIAGIALGSAAATAALPRWRHPATVLALVQAGAAAASLVVVAAIGRLPATVGELVQANADRMDRLMALEFGGVFLLLAPPCLLFGAAFPLAVQLLARDAAGVGPATARAYAWNTVGAVLGAVLAGFVVLPRFGIRATLLAAAAAHALAGAAALAGHAPRRRAAAAVILTAFALAAVAVPRWDRELLSGGVYKYAVYSPPGRLEEELRAGELVYYREGAEVTVSVKRVGGTLSLAVDGKVDATSGSDMLTQRLLAHLPLLLHPAPREACVIGLGSGVTAGSALAHPLRRLEVVEISPEVVEAARLFGRFNRGVLEDPRLALRVADGRNHLLLTHGRYDVIISEPSNPWMAGVSSLFTRDFFFLARSRLAPGGLFCQWAHIYNMHPGDLRTVLAGFTDAFPAAALFLVNEGDVLLVGAGAALPAVDVGALAGRMAEPAVRDDLGEVEVRTPAGLATLYALGGPALARLVAGAPRHTDDRPRLEFSAPRYLHADTAAENRARIQEAARGAAPPPGFAELAAVAASPPAGVKLERARMLERAGSHGWAMDVYREALDESRLEESAYEGLVRAALKSGRASEAEEFLRGQAAGPAPVSARIALGLLDHNRDRPAEALEALAAAAAADPRSVRALLLGAEVQETAGNVDAAEALARRALEVSPGDAEAESLLASISLAGGRTDEALGRAESVLARDPGAGRALEVAAIARAQKGDRAGARRAFEALVEAEPDGWAHLNNFAVFEMEGGNPRAAARLFHQAVSVNPGNVTGYRGLSEAARSLGDPVLQRRAEAALRRLGVPAGSP